MKILCILSAPAGLARPFVRNVLETHSDATFVFYVRNRDRRELSDLLANHEVRSDKPSGGRSAMVRALRNERFDAAHALAFGHRSYVPAKLLLWACRANVKRWHGDHGEFDHSLWRPDLLLAHAMRRGMIVPAAGWVYRSTIGRVLGGAWTLARYATRTVPGSFPPA